MAAAQLKAGLAAPRTESSVPSLMSRIGGALSFSHLAGLGRGTAKKVKANARAEEEEPGEDEDGQDKKNKKGKKSEKGDEDKNYAEGGDSEDEHEDQDRSNGDASAEEEEPGEDEDGQDKKNKKGKKGKAKRADDSGESEEEEMEDEEADEEEEMRGNSPAAAARRRERARCAAIFNDKAAARNPQLAAQLAFNTAMTRGEAIAVLRGTPGAGAGNQSQQRAERNPRLGPGGREELSSSQAAAAGWDRAMKQVRPDLIK